MGILQVSTGAKGNRVHDPYNYTVLPALYAVTINIPGMPVLLTGRCVGFVATSTDCPYRQHVL